MIELLNQKIIKMKFPSKKQQMNMDFFTLALYLQELNKLDEIHQDVIKESINQRGEHND